MWEYFIHTIHSLDTDGIHRWKAEWATLIDGNPSNVHPVTTCTLDTETLRTAAPDVQDHVAEFLALIQVIEHVNPRADTYIYTRSSLVAEAINGRVTVSGILCTLNKRAQTLLKEHIGTEVNALAHVKTDTHPPNNTCETMCSLHE